MTYAMLYQCLIEAEQRRDNPKWPQNVRDNSAETVRLIEQRMKMDGLTRAQLKADYKASLLPESAQ